MTIMCPSANSALDTTSAAPTGAPRTRRVWRPDPLEALEQIAAEEQLLGDGNDDQLAEREHRELRRQAQVAAAEAEPAPAQASHQARRPRRGVRAHPPVVDEETAHERREGEDDGDRHDREVEPHRVAA
jgi:hypothetical protein